VSTRSTETQNYFHVLSNKSKRNWLFVSHNQIKLIEISISIF